MVQIYVFSYILEVFLSMHSHLASPLRGLGSQIA